MCVGLLAPNTDLDRFDFAGDFAGDVGDRLVWRCVRAVYYVETARPPNTWAIFRPGDGFFEELKMTQVEKCVL